MKSKALLLLPFLLYALSLRAQVPELWGVLQNGCAYKGVVFKINEDGTNFSTAHCFNYTNGAMYPYSGLVQTPNGLLYGTVGESNDNVFGSGVIYCYNIKTNIYNIVYEFKYDKSGVSPTGTLLKANDGKLYGMAQGGINYQGVLYRFYPQTNNYTKLFAFDGANGRTPLGNLIQASNGILYGITKEGGIIDKGVLFSYDLTTHTFAKLHDFLGSDGANPVNAVIQANDGHFYGVTSLGGKDTVGVIFKYDPDSNITSGVYYFRKSGPHHPSTALFQASNGLLYGMTYSNASGVGALFSFDLATDSLSELMDFNNGIEGYSEAKLIQGDDGKLYGTAYGNDSNLGSIFSYEISTGIGTVLRNFGGSNGARPVAELLEASNGKLYGTTQLGGKYNSGVVFQFNPLDNNYKCIATMGQTDGSYPTSGLTRSFDGLLIGTTPFGGTNNQGVIYGINPNDNSTTVLYNFIPKVNGFAPLANLVLASNGKMYGTTTFGGLYGYGTIYSFDPQSVTYVKLYDFKDDKEGLPKSALMQASNGFLYGTSGSSHNRSGIIYCYNIDQSAFSVVAEISNSGGSISEPFNSFVPQGHLTEANNALLYGSSTLGGTFGLGLIYSFDPSTNTISDCYDFNTLSGANPLGSLINLPGGGLCGMCSQGTAGGTLFKYNPADNSFEVLYNFTQTSGRIPWGSPCLGSDGSVYGITNAGGSYNNGTLFNFNINTNTFTVLRNFYDNVPGYGDLTDIMRIATASSSAIQHNLSCNIFPFENSLHIKMNLPSTRNPISISIVNAVEEMILSEDEGMQSDLFEKDIALRKPLATGIYVVIINCGDAQFTKQVLLSGL